MRLTWRQWMANFFWRRRTPAREPKARTPATRRTPVAWLLCWKDIGRPIGPDDTVTTTSLTKSEARARFKRAFGMPRVPACWCVRRASDLDLPALSA